MASMLRDWWVSPLAGGDYGRAAFAIDFETKKVTCPQTRPSRRNTREAPPR